MAQAYFNCVNDNGGINGRPIQYVVAEEQTNPQQVAALAAKLIQDDKVLAIVGSTSLIDCTVNHAFYEQNNFNVIVAGVPFDCFQTPNISAVNMGPYYSSLGAGQYLVRSGVKSMVAVGANVPGGDHDISGPGAFAKANNIPVNGEFLENVPISDASGIALKVVQAAGDGGGVVINFTPPEGLKILQAAEQQGLIDKVKWAWSTPGNDVSVAQALGPAWNGKLGVNAELALVDSTGPDNTLYQQITKQYAPSIPLGSFGQMGFVSAAVITRTLLDLPRRSVDSAGRQRRDSQHQELQNRHPVPAVVLRRPAVPRAEQRRSHGRPEQPRDGPEGGLLPDRGPARQQPGTDPRRRGRARTQQVTGVALISA